jgi:putative two-component system response regulator
LLRGASDSGSAEPPASRVLVVDDDLLSCRLAVSALRNARLDAQYAQDPLQALPMARQTRFDLLLLDFEMPRMDGIELCRQLRLLPGYAQVPVVFVTGHDDFEARLNLSSAGGDDLISKPFFPIELAVKAVMHLLGMV